MPVGVASSAVLLAAPFLTALSLPDALGWVGAIIYCLAYFLLAEERITRQRYMLLNIAAPAILIPAYHAQGNWPALWMSIAWTVLSGAGYLRLAMKRGVAA
jgi:hypothetical protein